MIYLQLFKQKNNNLFWRRFSRLHIAKSPGRQPSSQFTEPDDHVSRQRKMCRSLRREPTGNSNHPSL